MTIQMATKDEAVMVAPLIAQFRVELKGFKGIIATVNTDSATEEFLEYLDADYPIYLWKEQGQCLGYLVCRVEKPIVWVESLYVHENHRRRGIASALFKEAEALAVSYGEEMVYNYVHPNNEPMIAFLRQRGYDVLNLIEIRKSYTSEKIQNTLMVGKNQFKY